MANSMSISSDNEMPQVGYKVTYGYVPDIDDDYRDPDSIYGRVSKWYEQWRSHAGDWRKESRESFDFYSLHQWTEEERTMLAERDRVPITFDRTAPVINMVCGLEINNRQEITYYPRQEGSAGKSELLSSAAIWARQGCDAEDEESDAFKDLLICGMGWTETRMDFDSDPDGAIIEERLDPLEMFWDAAAGKKNLMDAKYIGRIRKWAKQDVLDAWPDVDISSDAAPWDYMDDVRKEPHDAEAAPFYRNDQSGNVPDRDEWAVCHVQWSEKEDCVRVNDPWTNEVRYLSHDEFDKFAKKFYAVFNKPVQGFATKQKVVWQAFICGSTVLEVTKGAYRHGFTFNCMTGYRDRNHRTWYGLMRAMKDPQRWSNKLYSQILYIINSQAKGGIMIEADAVESIRDLEESWTDPSGITVVNSGAISGEKIKEKPVGQVAPALGELLQQAMEGVPATTGVNSAAMGQSEDDNSGYLEYQRRQSAVTVLAPFFDAKRLFTKQQGRVLLFFIQNYLSDNQLIRIGGPNEQQYVKLTRDKTLGDYDIVVDESPSSPNQKERNWSALIQILPMAAKLGIPIPPDVINELPISEDLKQKWIAFIKQKQNAPPNPVIAATAQEKQANAALKQAQAVKTKADTVDTVNRLGADTTETYSRATLNQAQAQDIEKDGHRKDFQTIHDAVQDQRDQRQEDRDASHARKVLSLDTLKAHHQVKTDQAQLGQAQQQIDNPPQPTQGNNA